MNGKHQIVKLTSVVIKMQDGTELRPTVDTNNYAMSPAHTKSETEPKVGTDNVVIEQQAVVNPEKITFQIYQTDINNTICRQFHELKNSGQSIASLECYFTDHIKTYESVMDANFAVSLTGDNSPTEATFVAGSVTRTDR